MLRHNRRKLSYFVDFKEKIVYNDHDFHKIPFTFTFVMNGGVIMDERGIGYNTHDITNHYTWNEFSDHYRQNDRKFQPIRLSLRIAIVYIVLGVLWILFTDKIVNMAVTDKNTIETISLVKGWIYVIITGVMIYVLVFRALKKLRLLEEELITNYRQLSVAHEDIEAAYEEITATEDELRRRNLQLELNQRKLIESELKFKNLAYTDVLTGLPNKTFFESKISNSFSDGSIEKCVLIHIDSDHLKYINETFGHTFGDLFVRSLASRLKTFEDNRSTLFRKGSDEFIILFCEHKSLEEVMEVANQILHSIRQPFYINDSVFRVSANIGISTYPENGSNIDELLTSSGIALHKARSSGKNKYSFYDEGMHNEVMERFRIEKLLFTALENNEFTLHYQPQVDIGTGIISGFEALLRWNSPELGYVYPDKFITIAEDTHLIISIGKWVLQEACRFLKELHNQGLDELTVSVNISIVQLMYSSVTDTVIDVLNRMDLEPKYLELEITESILMESVDAINEQLNKLREIGMNIALDDFGKGYSSLSYLKRLPISTLKIDREFLDDFSLDDNDKDLIGSIIMIARNMGLKVVVEGVETKEQFAFLKEKRCPRIQGYFFSRPVPEKEAVELVRKNKGFENHA